MTRARDHRTTEPTASASSYPRYRKPYALFMEYLVAGLDVYEDEPHVPQELLELDNAVLLPHVASAASRPGARWDSWSWTTWPPGSRLGAH